LVVHDLVMPRFRACHGRWFGFMWPAVDVAELEVAGEVVGRHSWWGVGNTARARSPVNRLLWVVSALVGKGAGLLTWALPLSRCGH